MAWQGLPVALVWSNGQPLPCAQGVNCQCQPLPDRLGVPAVQNPCWDAVALLPGVFWGRSEV